MSDSERRSRESFYKNLVWVVNGAPFQQNFEICHRLPDPTEEVANDLVWYPAQPGMLGTIDGMCWRRSENPHYNDTPHQLVKLLSWQDRDRIVEETYRGHHQFTWLRPRGGWLDAVCPVFFDFGGSCLWRLERYDTRGLRSVRAVAKAAFIADVMSLSEAAKVGSLNHS